MHAAAELWVAAAASAIGASGRFAVALSGGATPQGLYRLLAAAPYASGVDWSRVHVFWGDERCVPPDDPASNYRMAREAFLSRVPIAPERVHPVPTVDLSPEDSARRYERDLQSFHGGATLDAAKPLFAAILLGLGDDGHTASLIPGHPALAERRRWVVPVAGARPEVRITLTIPVLGSSRSTAVLVSGSGKRHALGRALAADLALPTTAIQPAGQWIWLADQAAAPEQ
jgi:6-phosphogluconolactonase